MVLKVNVPNIGKVQAEIRKALGNMETDKFVTVGVHEGAGVHENSEINNAELGAAQHFGAGDIPARPFLDVGAATANRTYIKLVENGFRNGVEPDQILNQIGVVAVAAIQNYMNDLKTPPNAPATIAAKGSSNPLIDTGELKQAMTYVIASSKPKEGIQ